jgi:hypothetical protein
VSENNGYADGKNALPISERYNYLRALLRRTTTFRTPAEAAPSKVARLRDGSSRAACDRFTHPYSYAGPLLARRFLECSLTVPAEPLLVVILGPTGSGKTSLSITLAERFHGEIVNCDSVAMYRGFEIGTAKPSAAERVRAPHHLLDLVEPTTEITAGEYARRARSVLEEIKSRGALPIVVGGTGL